MDDSGDDGGSASSFTSSVFASQTVGTPLSSNGFTSNSPASSAVNNFSRAPLTPPPEPNSSASGESHVCKVLSMDQIRQFATAKAVSLRALKAAAKRLGLVITLGARTKGRNKRIGFGVKKKVRALMKAVGQFPTTLFKFNERKDGFLHPGTSRSRDNKDVQLTCICSPHQVMTTAPTVI